MKKITRRTLGKNLAPVFSFLGCLAVFAISLLSYSSTYAVITSYGPIRTPSSIVSTEGYSASITLPRSVNFSLSGNDFDQLIKKDANVSISTNAVTGYKMYVSIENTSLRTNSPTHEIPYDNQTVSPMQKSDLNTNTWGIFLKKSGLDYVIPLCTSSTLSTGCLVSESNGPVTNKKVDVDYGIKINSNTRPGAYSANLLYSAVINSSVTGEFPIKKIENAKVPLLPNGDTVSNSAGNKLKHKFRIQVPVIEYSYSAYSTMNYEKRYKVTVGGVECVPQGDTSDASPDGYEFDCIADFSTANPKFTPGQKAEVVVETKPYGYIYSKQNAVEFIAAESTFSYTGGPQEMVAPLKGKYLIEAMGANGADRTAAQAGLYWYGSPNTFLGGRGGYSAGYKDFEAGEKSMVFVGGKGEAGNNNATVGYYAKGGFNGGGHGSPGLLIHGTTMNAWGGNGGGGGTDVRKFVATDFADKLTYRSPTDTVETLLYSGPWANLEHGLYQTVIETENLPDDDLMNVLAYYDFNFQQLQAVYYQKTGNYISVYFAFPESSPAATHLPAGIAGPGIEIRLQVKTSNQTARVKSMKFYKLHDRYIVAGGGGGGSLTHMGGNGGGASAGDSQYIGPTSEPDYNNFFTGLGADNVTRGGGGFGFGAYAPRHNNGYPEVGARGDILGRPGAGGGWHGGFTGVSAYDRFQVSAGAGGGSGYVGGVTGGVSYAMGDAGQPTTPWTSLEPSDKNGIVKIRIADYQGGV